MAERRQERRGTAAQWAAANPVLAAGEWGYQTDGDKVVKIGDGTTAWADLDPALSATYVSVNEDGDLVHDGDVIEVGGNTIDYTGAASDVVITTDVTDETAPRFVQLADGSWLWSDGEDDTAPQHVGMFFEKRELWDYGAGEPFSQGMYYFVVVGDRDDPLGEASETGTFGPTIKHGHNWRVNGFTWLDNSVSVFSVYQPYMVIGRKGIDNRDLTKRPTGYGEEVAIGIARTDTDYFTDIQPGDVAIRAYADGPGTNGRVRRILLGSNTGGQSTYADSTVSVGGDDVTLHRPLNLAGASDIDEDGYLYLKVDGRRKKARVYDVAEQITDTFTGVNGHGLVHADTGQMYYLSAGTWQKQSGKAMPLTKPGTFALALLTGDIDQTIEADVTPGTMHAAWLAIRVTNGQAHQMLIAVVDSSTGAVRIEKKDGGSYTTLASGTTAGWATDTTHRLSATAEGNLITVKIDGVTALTHTLTGGDVALFASAAYCGLLSFDLTTAFENLSVSSGTDEAIDSGGGGASGLLAVASLNDGSTDSTTSSTATDLDATNLAVTFTVPASGAVLVTLNAWVNPGANTTYNWCLREGSSIVTGSDCGISYGGAGLQYRESLLIHLTGLTPGEVKTWKWAHKVSFGSTQCQTLANPATMKVEAA